MNENAIAKYGPFAAARKSSLLSQGDMAKKLGCSVPKLVDMEKDPESMTLGTLGRFYQSVGTDGKAIIERFVNGLFLA